MTDMPIEIVHETIPPTFYWKYKVDGRVVDCNGMVQASMETALTDLILLARRLTKENAELRGKLMDQANASRDASRNMSAKKTRV